MARRLSWPILADFGQARIDQNLAQMGQDGANLEPRWRQESPSWGQDGHLEAILGSFLEHFRSLEKWQKCKNEQHYSVLAAFWGLGDLVGSSWGVFWAILGTSWALLGDLGVKLGTSWQHVGTKMA